MIIAKFGGTSVSTAKNIKTIQKIVLKEMENHPVVVVSALSGVTDLLTSLPNLSKEKAKNIIDTIKKMHLKLIDEIWEEKSVKGTVIKYVDDKLGEILVLIDSKEDSRSFLDSLLSYGEILSSYIVSKAIETENIGSKQVIATDLIITNSLFGSADFLPEETKIKTKKVLEPMIYENIVPVVTGFIGATKDGKITTLGRGGSDYTASILGFCLHASEIQIWTDVNGIFTSDPRVVKNAKALLSVSYREASELAAFGAKILHPKTIKPAIKAGIPVRVLNTFNTKSQGTLIVDTCKLSYPITAISFKRKIILVNMYSTEMLFATGFLARIFEIFSRNDISIDLVSVSEVSVSVTLDEQRGLESALHELAQFTSVTVSKDCGMVSLIGEGIVTSRQVIHKIFDILDKEGILVKVISLGATDINVSIVVKSDQVEKAVKVLHDKLLMKLRREKILLVKTKGGQK